MCRVCHVHPRAVIRPRSELYWAALLVKREVADVNVTRGFKDSAWFPMHGAIVVQQNAYLLEVWG